MFLPMSKNTRHKLWEKIGLLQEVVPHCAYSSLSRGINTKNKFGGMVQFHFIYTLLTFFQYALWFAVHFSLCRYHHVWSHPLIVILSDFYLYRIPIDDFTMQRDKFDHRVMLLIYDRTRLQHMMC